MIKKDGLPEVAQEIVDDLKWDFNVLYDEKDAVGRRYRRQDANGTPFCITVDRAGNDYLREMCDEDRYLVIEDIAELPLELPKIYSKATRDA